MVNSGKFKIARKGSGVEWPDIMERQEVEGRIGSRKTAIRNPADVLSITQATSE
jgi:hypothetical protein